MKLTKFFAFAFLIVAIAAFIVGPWLQSWLWIVFGWACLALSKTQLLEIEIEKLRRKIDGR